MPSCSDPALVIANENDAGELALRVLLVANQRKLAGKEASPKLVNIDLQPYQTVQACERADIMNIGGFSDSVFNVISAFLADNNQRFVAEVEAIEL